tara:strand:+ start:112 stop:1041 length:930 start_codon:yes stop_codon:yes gene_type:complete
MRSKRIHRKSTNRKQNKRTKTKGGKRSKKYRKNTKSKRIKRRKKYRKNTKSKGRKKYRKNTKRRNKFQKRITEDYIKSFRSPHRVPGDCGICSLNFLNVLPIEILQDVIDEIGCDGLNSSEVKRYFDQAYGSEHNFIWQPSELLVDSNLNYKIEYIKSWLVTEVSKISPGYVMLVDLKRRTQGGHFVVLGKDLNGEMVLFDPTYGLGIYMGISNIISYLIKEKAFFLLILHSDIIEDRTEINPRFSSIPSNTGANTMLNYNCRLRHIQESRMQTEKYYDQLLLRLMNEQRERESRYLQEQQQYQMEIND